MTDQREVYQKAIAKLIARFQGKESTARTFLGVQVHSTNSVEELMQLPCGNVVQLQDLDPTSATFGEFLSMVDLDPVDGGVVA
jgi:hypothetical protein